MIIAETSTAYFKEKLTTIKNFIAGKSTKIMAVSKTIAAEQIEAAILAGFTLFGENRVQEAEKKWRPLKQKYPHIELHLIGPLQSNKLNAALTMFDAIQTLDRASLAEKIHNYYHTNPTAQRPLFIEINIGRESQKAGIMPEAADDFIHYCRYELRLPIIGLMCIPPQNEPPRPFFKQLYAMAQQHNLSEISMGMSNDYQTAIEEGATIIRVGSFIFEERP